MSLVSWSTFTLLAYENASFWSRDGCMPTILFCANWRPAKNEWIVFLLSGLPWQTVLQLPLCSLKKFIHIPLPSFRTLGFQKPLDYDIAKSELDIGSFCLFFSPLSAHHYRLVPTITLFHWFITNLQGKVLLQMKHPFIAISELCSSHYNMLKH